MANDFITDVTDGSCQLAEHRGSKTVEMKDLALYLSSWINRAMRNRKELGYWCGRVFNSNNKFGIRSRVWCIISIVNKQSTLVPCPFSNELSITLNFRISFFLRNRNRCRTKHGWLEKERGGRIRQIEERLLKRFCFLLNDSMSNWRRWRRINGSSRWILKEKPLCRFGEESLILESVDLKVELPLLGSESCTIGDWNTDGDIIDTSWGKFNRARSPWSSIAALS